MADDLNPTLQAGIAAFKAGDKATARAHFLAVVDADETSDQAWLWLAITVGSIILLSGVIGLILAFGVLKLRRWGDWGNWGFIGLNWVLLVYAFIQQHAVVSALLAANPLPQIAAILSGYRAGAALFPIWLTVSLLCLALGWKLFT